MLRTRSNNKSLGGTDNKDETEEMQRLIRSAGYKSEDKSRDEARWQQNKQTKDVVGVDVHCSGNLPTPPPPSLYKQLPPTPPLQTASKTRVTNSLIESDDKSGGAKGAFESAATESSGTKAESKSDGSAVAEASMLSKATTTDDTKLSVPTSSGMIKIAMADTLNAATEGTEAVTEVMTEVDEGSECISVARAMWDIATSTKSPELMLTHAQYKFAYKLVAEMCRESNHT
jgi:hypothetical protein